MKVWLQANKSIFLATTYSMVASKVASYKQTISKDSGQVAY